MKSAKVLAIIAIVVFAAAFATYVANRPMDFRVYHYGARGVFEGTRPVYGATSGMGWPMHYRYPPLFLLLFVPFAWLPLGPSAAAWLLLKIVVLLFLLRSLALRLGPKQWIIPLLLAGPYVIQDFRYGNAQFFVFALTAAGLILARERPLIAAAALALAISIKVWPLFFIPYFVARGSSAKLIAATLLIVVVLTAAPSIYFGFGGNWRLLGQWFEQEFATQTAQEEIWFPSQSLRGVLMRYLTVVDYSKVPDSKYPPVNVVSWSPTVVRTIWFIAAALIYAAFLWMVHSRRTDSWIESGLAFCLVALLEPFTQKYALVILLFPAIVATKLIHVLALRRLVLLSIVLVCVQPLIPGSSAQRFVQVLGFDFAAAAILTLALASATLLYRCNAS